MQSALQAPLTQQKGGWYQASIAPEGLHITRGSVAIAPSFGQEATIAFLPQGGGKAMVMGEVPETDAQEPATVAALLAANFQLTAIHNHITGLNPAIDWEHFSAMGNPVALAGKIRDILKATTPLSLPASQPKTTTSLPAKRLASILGGDLTVDDGVVQVDVVRGDKISEDGVPLPSSMEVDTEAYFEPLPGGRAATTGDFCLTTGEVAPVITALNKTGMQITALHNHMIDSNPVTYFVHWFGTGNATSLAQQLRSVLDRADYPKQASS